MVLTFLIPPFFFVTVPVSVVYGFTHASGRAKWVVAIVAAIAMLFIWMLFVPTSVGQHH
jgi:ABC-type uncharacterized transport system permease subunit